LRHLNGKTDERQLVVADDGKGGWDSIVICGALASGGARIPRVAVEIRGHLAHDMVSSEVQIADWSTSEDRVPATPPLDSRGVGSIDARFLTEGAIPTALRDDIGVSGRGDSVNLVAHALEHRGLVDSLLLAAKRGARPRVLLDAGLPASQAAAAELVRGGVEVRWRTAGESPARYVLVRHANDVWLALVSADLTRRCLEDSTFEAGIELHMPASASAARAAAQFYAKAWDAAAPYAEHADETRQTYWRYRAAELTGLALF
jgi:hypothetical protein